jgi:hypothetical protein
MFNTFAHTAIDMVQTSKKMVVEHTIKHEGLAKIINDFVDAQTSYTKSAVNTGIDTFTKFYGLATRNDFGKEVMEAYNIPTFETAKTAKASKKA